VWQCETHTGSYPSHTSAKLLIHRLAHALCVFSARLIIDLGECKVFLPCEVILEWIKLYKVRQKPWDLSSSLAIVFDTPTWCGVERTLCAGDVEIPFLSGERSSLVEAVSRWPRQLGECLSGEPLWRVKWCSWERLGDREAILLCACFNNVDYGWLSTYLYHRINRLSRGCFVSSLFTFPHYFHVILACLYFPRAVSC
jgi:hypothetical protein